MRTIGESSTERERISRGQWLLIAVTAAAALWLLYPALYSTQVEAFSASLQAQAIAANHGVLSLNDQAYPVNTQYLYGSRPMLVAGLRLFLHLPGLAGDASFRGLMLVSFALFAACSVVVARRWSGEYWVLCAAAVLLFPGMVEVGFFFADNLPSAALAVAAMACVGRRSNVWAGLAVGFLLAFAVETRLDAVFAVPFVLALACMQEDFSAKSVGRLLLGGLLGAAVGFALGLAITGVSIRQSLQIGSYFAKMHFGLFSWADKIRSSLEFFFGLPGLLMLGIGVWENLRSRPRRWNVCFMLLPAVMYAYFLTKALEPRDFFLLGTPFVVMIAATGMRRFKEALMQGGATVRMGAVAVLLVCACAVAGRPVVRVTDGPHAVVGRLWSPMIWRQWQRDVDSNLQKCDALIESAKPGERMLVISSMYNADRYVHLRLLEHGFALTPVTRDAGWPASMEVLERNGTRFVHLRTENPYGLLNLPPHNIPYVYVQALQLEAELGALSRKDYDRAYLVTWGDAELQAVVAGSTPYKRLAAVGEFVYPHGLSVRGRERSTDGALNVVELSDADLASLRENAREVVEKDLSANHGEWVPLRDVGQIKEFMTLPFWQPK